MATASRHIFTLLLTILVTACSRPDGVHYADFRAIGADGWAYGDTIMFVPELTDSIADGQLVVSVCHDDDYVYANLWLELSYKIDNGDSIRTLKADTIDMRLANRYGRWFGQGFGASFQASDTISPHFKLHRGDTLMLRHIMRVDTVDHISQVGLTLSPATTIAKQSEQ